MEMTRRELLRLAGWLGFAPFFSGGLACTSDTASGDGLPEYEYDGDPGHAGLFAHGVASGDPLTASVILWTRVSPASDGPLEVFWEVAHDEAFVDRVAAGWQLTDGLRDYTVKVDAVGLVAGTSYFYRFRALGRESALGRTRTAADGSPATVTLGVCSCADYESGFYYGYRFLAERELDAVVHLGDYIYEYGARGGVRDHDPPHELLTLADYRRRYAQHHGDPDLQAAHARHPFIVVWDDHETANNSWQGGAQNHTPETEGAWADRRAAAQQAWAEWIPVRESADGRIFRSLRFGDLVDLIMLDTRIWGREEQASGPTDRDVGRDPQRQLLGADQEAWLFDQLASSTARWKVLGQQVMLAQLKGQRGTNANGGGEILNVDQWDGYWAARDRLFAAIRNAELDDVVVLTGDIHSSWANDLTEDPNNPEAYDPETGQGSLGVELVAPGITSGIEFNPNSLELLERLARQNNPHIRWLDLSHRGYVVLALTPERARATWWLLDDIDDPVAGTETAGAVFEVEHAANRWMAG